MPEGPSIVILKELVKKFEGRKIIEASGNSKLDLSILNGKKVIAFESWGKHFLIRMKDLTVRIHFMLFGTYRIDERKDSPPRLSLLLKNGELNFYACSVKFLEGDIDSIYDRSSDVLSDSWSPRKALNKLRKKPDTLVCDALLDQEIFSGVGNIIKNEVLYRIKVHPLNRIKDLPPKKLSGLIREARNYSYDFLEWKKQYVLKKNWLAHTKRTCKRCDLPIIKKHLGKTNRRTFYCEGCQLLYR